MSSSSDGKKRRDRISGFPSWAFDSSIQKIIERSKIHILPDSISSQIARAAGAVEALKSAQFVHTTFPAQMVEQQRSLASAILGRHGEMFAAVEAATRSEQEIGHAARAAIESMKTPGIGAAAQAMRMISPLIDSNQLTPPAYTAYASMLESSFAARAGAASALASIHNLSQMGEIASIASGLRFSHLTIPNLDSVTGNVSRLMQHILAGVEQDIPAGAHELREYYEEVVAIEDAPAKTLTALQVLRYLEFILVLLMFLMELASFQAAHDESRLTAEYREQNLEIQRDLLTQAHIFTHHLQKANGMDPEQTSGLTEYVVVRSVNLRVNTGTGADSHIITTLHPNQKVRLIQRGTHPNKKWIYVSYIDHIEGLPRYGWVYKKYLKRVGS